MYGPTTITTKGQVTIPGELRLLLNAQPGDKAIFTLSPSRKQAVMEVVSTKNVVEELAGSLHRPGMKYVPLSTVRQKAGFMLGKYYESRLKTPTKK